MEPDTHDDHFTRQPSFVECASPPIFDLEAIRRREDASRRKDRTILCALVIALLSNFCYYASELPLLRLVEYKLCDTYYENRTLPPHVIERASSERSCKIPQIQDEVALVIGSKTALDAIPRELTSLLFPCGCSR